MCCVTIAIMKDHHLSSRAWKRSNWKIAIRITVFIFYRWLYLTVITGNWKTAIRITVFIFYHWLYLSVITGKEAEPDADYCQHLAHRFTPCFDAHTGPWHGVAHRMGFNIVIFKESFNDLFLPTVDSSH